MKFHYLLFILLFPAIALAQTAPKVLSASSFNQTMQSRKATAIVVDVRTPQEFASGHLAGAININVSDPRFDAQIAALDHKKAVMVYCRSGGRSAAAARKIAAAGFKEIFDLQGGVMNWAGAGFPLVR